MKNTPLRKNVLKKSGLVGIALLALLLAGVLAPPVHAQAVRPLDDVLEDWQGYDWDWIVDVAGWEAKNDGPLYPSAPPVVPQYETFEGDFAPQDADTKIAIFSDDGCDVYIDGVKVHAYLNQGQGLPNLAQSLRKIPFSFTDGQTYRIKVVYSNTNYTGQTDIDGASLFAYSADKDYEVLFTGSPRACAGGVDDLATATTDDDAHIFTLSFNAKRGVQNLANTLLAFSFSNNQSHNPNKKAKFRTAANTWAETTTVTTDANGNGSIKVLSSDIVSSQTKIIVKHDSKEIEEVKLNGNEVQGGAPCNFVASERLRRFGLINFPTESDTGWIFNASTLLDPAYSEETIALSGTTPAKVYVKFQLNPGILRDTNYFNADGTPRRPLDDYGNWKFVNGHKLRIRIVEITLQQDMEFSGVNSDYATLLNANGQPAEFVEVVTANDGAAQVQIQAGLLINEAKEVVLTYEDEAEW